MKTSELTGMALDWAVAKANGKTYIGKGQLNDFRASRLKDCNTYSVSWAVGGPIIEREKIDVFTEKNTPESWVASIPRYQNSKRLIGWRLHQYGSTPLIAAMRCYCYSKLGDEIDVPEELLK